MNDSPTHLEGFDANGVHVGGARFTVNGRWMAHVVGEFSRLFETQQQARDYLAFSGAVTIRDGRK
jgi:hypothetical protein